VKIQIILERSICIQGKRFQSLSEICYVWSVNMSVLLCLCVIRIAKTHEGHETEDGKDNETLCNICDSLNRPICLLRELEISTVLMPKLTKYSLYGN
jgi:hypothetical protein